MGRRVSQKQRAMTLAASAKAKRAAELTQEGWTLKAIARELGYKSASGVSMLLEGYRIGLPREELEKLRDRQLARLATVQLMALEDSHSKSPGIRDKGQKRLIAAVMAEARISGTVKAPPPVVVVHGEEKVDLSRLSIDELEAWQNIQRKLREPAIVVQAEVIDAQPVG